MSLFKSVIKLAVAYGKLGKGEVTGKLAELKEKVAFKAAQLDEKVQAKIAELEELEDKE